MSLSSNVPKNIVDSILQKSEKIEGLIIKGYDFNNGVDYEKLFKSYATMGIQASNLAQAIDEINKMINWKPSDEPQHEKEEKEEEEIGIGINNFNSGAKKDSRCTIFLGYTSNMISCGMREIIRYLCQHKMVDIIVTTAGGIEEDFIKCLAPTYLGEFELKGSILREKGINRIGNMLVPNDNYCKFENWIGPLFYEMYKKQVEENIIFSPSTFIDYLGSKINNPESVYYWCHKNKIPVFCPALTDGSIGDMLYFFSYKKNNFIIDINEDIKRISKLSTKATKTGIIILGGGVVKHHICNANLMRNGADYSVYINTAVEYDASDAGARPDEAVSWGKIKAENTAVKVYSEASLVFPIIVAETFAKNPKLASKL